MDQIQHWKHKHPLLLRTDKIEDRYFYCNVCYEDVVAPYNYYACDSCKFYYIHKSCSELPEQIDHPFHPSHPLYLRAHHNYVCDFCRQHLEEALSFECLECDFYLDVECALMPPITCKGKEHMQHFLIEVDSKDITSVCLVCHTTLSSGGVYGCTNCKLLLHKSCAELPRKILHPHHPNHDRLTLRVAREWFTCRLCSKKDRLTLSFGCDECGFQLCVKCGMAMKGTIQCEDHEHLLCFLEETYTKLAHCDGYDAYCRQPVASNSTEFSNPPQSSIFPCLDCDYRVHLLCGPLPSVIEFEFHLHRLILVDAFVEDDSGEYYCDICEGERDPRIRVYSCQGCKYVAHVHCLISEITNLLKGDLRDVELKTVGAQYWELPKEITGEVQPNSALNFKDLLDQLTEEELELFEVDFEWDTPTHEVNKEQQGVSQSNTNQLLDLTDEFIDELLQFSSFTKEDFMEFTRNLKRNFYIRKLKIKPADLALKIVDVKGYKVPFPLAPVLKWLLHKYGDISRKSTSSVEMKSIAFSFLCKVVKQMQSTRVLDITKDLLQDWYFYLKFASYRADFDTGFLKAPLEKVTRAFFGLQLTKHEVDVPKAIDKRIAERQSNIDELHRKIDELRSEIDGLKHKAEVSQKFSKTSQKLKFMNECLNEAAKLKWKNASEV